MRITRENLETETVARLVAERGDEDPQLVIHRAAINLGSCF